MPDRNSFAKDVDRAVTNAMYGIQQLVLMDVDIIGLNEVHPEFFARFERKITETCPNMRFLGAQPPRWPWPRFRPATVAFSSTAPAMSTPLVSKFCRGTAQRAGRNMSWRPMRLPAALGRFRRGHAVPRRRVRNFYRKPCDYCRSGITAGRTGAAAPVMRAVARRSQRQAASTTPKAAGSTANRGVALAAASAGLTVGAYHV